MTGLVCGTLLLMLTFMIPIALLFEYASTYSERLPLVYMSVGYFGGPYIYMFSYIDQCATTQVSTQIILQSN